MPHPHRLAFVLPLMLLAAAVLLRAQNPRDQQIKGTEPFTLRVVATGLGNPWEVTWGPDNVLWVTERTAFRVTRINPADGSKQVALTLDDAYTAVDQDGLLGMALHPELLKGRGNDFVYLAYVYDSDPGSGVARKLRVRRYTYDASRHVLATPVTVLDNLPAHDDHGGGRLVFGPDSKLYVSRGDEGANWLANACRPTRSQDLPTAADVQARDWSTYQGKFLRLNLDGSIPADNPVFNGVRSHIYSYGHRNPQGFVFGPTGLLYSSEHGPSSDDEVNLIQAGKNYGWPNVAGFKDDRGYVYSNWSAASPEPCQSLQFNNLDVPASVPKHRESEFQQDFMAPLATFFTVPPDYDFAKNGSATIAPGGADLYTSQAIPGWANSILVASMRSGSVFRLKLERDGRSVVGPPLQYFKSTNRIRDLAISPDGRRIFLSTDDHGSTQDDTPRRTDTLMNPGSILEYTYAPPAR